MKKLLLQFVGLIVRLFVKKADVSFIDFSLLDWAVPSVPIVVTKQKLRQKAVGELLAAYVPYGDYIVVSADVYARAKDGHLRDQSYLVHELRHAYQARHGMFDKYTMPASFDAYMASAHEQDAYAVQAKYLDDATAKYL